MSLKNVQKEELVITDSKLVKGNTLQPQKIGHQIYLILFANKDKLVVIFKQPVKEFTKMSKNKKIVSYIDFIQTSLLQLNKTKCKVQIRLIKLIINECQIMRLKSVQKEQHVISDINIVEDNILQPLKIGHQIFQNQFVFKGKVVHLLKQLVKECIKIIK